MGYIGYIFLPLRLRWHVCFHEELTLWLKLMHLPLRLSFSMIQTSYSSLENMPLPSRKITPIKPLIFKFEAFLTFSFDILYQTYKCMLILKARYIKGFSFDKIFWRKAYSCLITVHHKKWAKIVDFLKLFATLGLLLSILFSFFLSRLYYNNQNFKIKIDALIWKCLFFR